MRTVTTGVFYALLSFMVFSPSSLVLAGDERTIAADNAMRQAQFNLIKAVQTELKEAKFDPGGVDGLYGPRTDQALRAFQSAKGLEPDGILGPKTLQALGLQ